MATITVTMTAAQLRAMERHGKRLWLTPGASSPHWAEQIDWRDDRIVATVDSFLEASGFDSLEGFDDDEQFTLVIRSRHSDSEWHRNGD